VLEALAEIAFAPQFLPTRVEKERKAVLAEAQVRRAAAPRGAIEGFPTLARPPSPLPPPTLGRRKKNPATTEQMMNTIEYRVDCQLLQYLHEENNLGYRYSGDG
jgi:predicted Zn-dependent peptidase